MAMDRATNFAGGPALLPEEVLREAQDAVWNLEGSGVGILETGHRTPTFDRVLAEAVADVRAAGSVPSSHEIVFLPGGAQLMFGLLPLNALRAGDRARFLVTGVWPQRALADAQRAATAVGASAEAAWNGAPSFDALPRQGEWSAESGLRYLHYCSNNTIEGTQWSAPPQCSAPLVCDATSDILSRPWPFERHAVVFAGAQKNLGIAGVTLAIVERGFLESMREGLPLMLSLREHAKAGSRLNTPPTFAIWVAGRMAKWILRQGGVGALDQLNRRKAALVYGAIDQSQGFFRGAARPEDRSLLNIGFRCATPELDASFTREAAAAGLVGLEGHRITGGIRASMYNALPLAGAQALADFMSEFARRRG